MSHLENAVSRMAMICALSALFPVAAPAQDVTEAEAASGTPEDFLGTLTLSGERVARPLDETFEGVAVLAPDAPDVARPSANVNSVLPRTPNAFVQGPSELPSLRGVQGGGAGGLNSAAVTGAPSRLPIIVDDVARVSTIANAGLNTLWDVEQVEVLRGPQSLLRGRVGIAGAVVVQTAKPTDVFEAALQAGTAFNDVNDPQYFLNGMVSGPLGPRLAGRLTFELAKGDDPRRVIGGTAPFITEFETAKLRGQLAGEADVADGLRWNLTVEGQTGFVPQTRNLVEGPATTGRAFSDRAIRASAPTRTFDIDSNIVSFTTETDIGLVTFETITARVHDELSSRDEQTFPSRLASDETVWTQDLILSFGPEADLRAGQVGGLVGFSYEHRDQQFRATGVPLQAAIDVEAETTALYTDLRYGLSDRLTLSAGVRFQEFRDRRDIATTALFPPPFPPVTGASNSRNTEREVLPSLGIGYEIDDENSVGLSLRRGYTPGGAAVNAFTGAPYTFESENLWTLEATWRGNRMNERLRFGVTAFYNRFDDPQVFGPTVPGNRLSLQVFNQAEGESYGLEIDVDWQATADLSVNAALGLLKTEITRASPFTPGVTGNSFGQDPEVTASLGAVWSPSLDWQVDGRITYVGQAFNDFLNTPGTRIGDYVTVDVGVSRFFGQAELRADITNLFDETGKTRRIGADADVIAPRTLAVSLTRRF